MTHECFVSAEFSHIQITDEYAHDVFPGGWALERRHETVSEVVVDFIAIKFCPFCGADLARKLVTL